MFIFSMVTTEEFSYDNGYETLKVRKEKISLPNGLLEFIKTKNQGLPDINQDVLHITPAVNDLDEIMGYECRTAREFNNLFFDSDRNYIRDIQERILSGKTINTPIKKGKILVPEPYQILEELLIIYRPDNFIITKPANLTEFI